MAYLAEKRWIMIARMRGKSGVTPILGTMMLLLIILTMVATILWWGTPTIRALEVETQYTSAKGYFESLNREVDGLLMDGWGCARAYKISIPMGNLQLYKDTSPFILEEEVAKQADFKPKTVWVLSYNLPSSNYDVLFEDITDNRVDKFTIRRIDGTGDISSCKVSVECLEGERKGESNAMVKDIKTSGTSFNMNLYDVSRISVETSTKELIAEAYVFSLAPMVYRYPTDRGTFHLMQQNTGLSTDYPEEEAILQPLLMSEASLSGNEKTITLHMADFSPRGIYTTGSGDYTFKMRFSDVGYYGNLRVKDLRMTMDGDYQEAWMEAMTKPFRKSHLSSSKYTGFLRDDTQSQKGLIYHTPSSLFAQHQNLVLLNVVWAHIDVEIGS
jgi:hypothetical protein